MQSPKHIRTTVLPGKKIEVTSADLVEGEQVEVIIVFPSQAQKHSVLDIVENTPPPGLFKTADEVDEYLEGERESWDR